MQFQDFIEDQVFSPTLITEVLRTTKSEIAGHTGPRKGRLHAGLAGAGAEDTGAAPPDAGNPQPRRSGDGITARRLRLVPRRAPARFRRRYAGPIATRRQGRPRARLSRTRHGRRLRLSPCSGDALPRPGLPGTQSAVVLDALVRGGREPSWWAFQPARRPCALYFALAADRRTRSAAPGPANAAAHPLCL